MARFVIKTLAVAALVCLVIDLAASEDSNEYQKPQQPLPVQEQPKKPLPVQDQPKQSLPVQEQPKQPLPAQEQPKQPLPVKEQPKLQPQQKQSEPLQQQEYVEPHQEQEEPHQEHHEHHEHQENHETVSTTTAPHYSIKDKLKGFVTSVKEGASDAYESVSETVSGAAHSLDEKRKETVAGTKKLVNSAIDKIKDKYESFKHGDKGHADVPRTPTNSSEEHDASKEAKGSSEQ